MIVSRQRVCVWSFLGTVFVAPVSLADSVYTNLDLVGGDLFADANVVMSTPPNTPVTEPVCWEDSFYHWLYGPVQGMSCTFEAYDGYVGIELRLMDPQQTVVDSNSGWGYQGATVSILPVSPGSAYGEWIAISEAEIEISEMFFQCFYAPDESVICDGYGYPIGTLSIGESYSLPVVVAPPQQCTSDPPYSAPALQGLPQPTTVAGSLGASVDITGLTTANGVHTLQCVQRCSGGQNVWRLEGDIYLEPFKVEVETQMPATSMPTYGWMCATEPRIAPLMSHDNEHELRHAEKYLETLAPYRNVLGTTFGSQAICETAKNSVVHAVGEALDQRAYLESDPVHDSHQGWPRHIQICLGPNVVAPYTTPNRTSEWFCSNTWGPGGGLNPQVPGTCPDNDY